MIIYNKVWLANLLIREEVQKAHKAGSVDSQELKAVEEKYPVGFYTPNIFIRIGLFILTFIIVSFSAGLISLMLSDLHVIDTWGYFLFLGALTYIALELMVKINHHFKSGVDDALMWISGGLFLTAFIITQFQTPERFSYIFISFFIFLLSLYYALRFADVLMTTVSILSFIAFIFFEWRNLSSLGMTTMPFLIMIISALIYFFSQKNIGKKLTIYYTNCLIITQVVSLLILYLSGNFYVVQTLSAEIQDYTGPEAPSVPLAPFFWTWTILLPFVYLYFGIRKKDVILLRSGLILIAAAAFTFRNYYHVMPIEGTLSIIGIILLGVSYGVIKYLKTPKHGFTYEDLDEDNIMDKLKVESLIVSETFSGSPQPSEGTRFGGGDFGGGGSSGNF